MSLSPRHGYDISPPATAPILLSNGVGGMAPGDYTYTVTYVTYYGETTSSPVSALISSPGLVVLGLPLQPENNAIARKLYRTTVGNVLPRKLVATIANNTTQQYVDSKNDLGLGADEPNANFAPAIAVERGWSAYSKPLIHAVSNITATGVDFGSAAQCSQDSEYFNITVPIANNGIKLPPYRADINGMRVMLKNMSVVNLIVYPHDPAGIINGAATYILTGGAVVELVQTGSIIWDIYTIGGSIGFGGTVTLVNTGAGLVGGPITTTGTISLAPNAIVLDTNGLPSTYPTDLTRGVWYGSNTRANAHDATTITIGQNADTNASNSIALGNNTVTSNDSSIAIGNGIVANQNGGFFARHRTTTATVAAGFIAGTNELVETTVPIGGLGSSSYAYAYDTTVQSLPAPNTWQDITFSTNVLLDVWTHVAGSADFVCGTTGKYNIIITVTLAKTVGNVDSALRMTLNGVEVPSSLQTYHMHTSATEFFVAILDIATAVTAGQILRIQFAGDTGGNIIYTQPGAGFWATQPSVRLKIVRFAQ